MRRVGAGRGGEGTEDGGGPAPVRVGVTGHRALADPEAVAAEVDRILDVLAGPTGRPLRVVSSLAEGADRLVAHRVLARPDATLEVPLPLPPADYAADFATAESVQEFNDLLVRADRVDVVPASTLLDPQVAREDAYARAGSAMVAASDVVLALWDGRPARGHGGTAGVVLEALAAGRPVEVVTVERAS